MKVLIFGGDNISLIFIMIDLLHQKTI